MTYNRTNFFLPSIGWVGGAWCLDGGRKCLKTCVRRTVGPLGVSRSLSFLLLLSLHGRLPVQLTEVLLASPRRVGKGVLTSIEHRLLLNLGHARIRVSFEVVQQPVQLLVPNLVVPEVLIRRTGLVTNTIFPWITFSSYFFPSVFLPRNPAACLSYTQD